MLKNKLNLNLPIVKNSYHEHVLNYCIQNTHLQSFPKSPHYISDIEDIKILSLWLSGYMDRLEYAEYQYFNSFPKHLQKITDTVDNYILSLKALINEISNHEFISDINIERLSAYEKLYQINKDLKEYAELHEENSSDDYDRRIFLGSMFLFNLLEVNKLLDSAEIDSRNYTSSIGSLIFFLNYAAERLNELITYSFPEAFNDKQYSTLASLCFGIEFLNLVVALLNSKIVHTPDSSMENVFQCSVTALYSLGEDFTYDAFRYKYDITEDFDEEGNCIYFDDDSEITF